jgi:hypothetical protein
MPDGCCASCARTSESGAAAETSNVAAKTNPDCTPLFLLAIAPALLNITMPVWRRNDCQPLHTPVSGRKMPCNNYVLDMFQFHIRIVTSKLRFLPAGILLGSYHCRVADVPRARSQGFCGCRNRLATARAGRSNPSLTIVCAPAPSSFPTSATPPSAALQQGRCWR